MTTAERAYIVFGAPYLDEDEVLAVNAVLRSGWLGTGPKVREFQQKFSNYKTVTDAAAVASCTAALELSLRVAGIGQGDEVITTALTFCATVNAIIHTGATPVLADVDPVTWNISPDGIRRALTPRTRALLPVHMHGRPCAMDAILAIADEHRLFVVEDCAHAIETEYRGKKAGTFGDFGCFSFYPTKNMTTIEGGMVLARNLDHLQRIRKLALHGLSADAWKRFSDAGFQHYYVTDAGWKSNMTDVQAAIGITQLARLEQNWQYRLALWKRYDSGLRHLPLGLPAPWPADERHALHLYAVRLGMEARLSRDELMSKLHERGVGTGVHYLAIPEHPYYQEQFGWRPEHFPVAMKVGRESLSLPLSRRVTESDAGRVIETLTELLA